MFQTRFLTISLVATLALSVTACQRPDGCDGLDNDDDGYVDEDCSAMQDLDYGDITGDDPSDDTGETDTDTDTDTDSDTDSDTDTDTAGENCWFFDGDGDEFGDPDREWCGGDSPPYSYVDNNDDCDDADYDINPDADEVCDEDEVDEDCDGDVNDDDDSLADAPLWFRDADHDGFGDPLEWVESCEQPTGYVDNNDDCDDADYDINPDADEVCDEDEVDEDCDGDVNEDDAVDALPFFADSDDDGFGDPDTKVFACEQPVNHVDNGDDCDDTEEDINPDADEVCDTVDNDCDDDIDEASAIDATAWYRDLDEDGFGDSSFPQDACEQPEGYVADDGDCDDTSADAEDVFPGADEYCNGLDDDCDGTVDNNDAVDAAVWFLDSDGDGWGDNSTATLACDAPTNDYVAKFDDCDDDDEDVNPGATEVCNEVDDDCDGDIDEDVKTKFYADDDEDGFGDPLDKVEECSAPTGYIEDDQDCDDTDEDVNPNADEVCNGLDDDCDGTIDNDDALDATTWYEDFDGDQFGTSLYTKDACNQPAGFVDNDDDCDDRDASVNPDADELCNGHDDDCDAQTDEDDALDAVTWFEDADEDDFGNPAVSEEACDQPTGFVDNDDDCDDTSDQRRPGNTEICDDVDNDCDFQVDEGLLTTFFEDGDNDGYGDPMVPENACTAPAGYVLDNEDCDDNNRLVFPGATEVCNELDDDCDGDTDEGVTNTYYADADQDGYGGTSISVEACSRPTGFLVNHTDCDDFNNTIHPNATEYCNGRDDDCDGTVDDGVCDTGSAPVDDTGDTGDTGFGDTGDSGYSCLTDDDGDGFIDEACGGADCDDTRRTTNPDADEVCADYRDNDCNDSTDEVSCRVWIQTVDNGSTVTYELHRGAVYSLVDAAGNEVSIDPYTVEYAEVAQAGCWSVSDTCGQVVFDMGFNGSFFLTADKLPSKLRLRVDTDSDNDGYNDVYYVNLVYTDIDGIGSIEESVTSVPGNDLVITFE